VCRPVQIGPFEGHLETEFVLEAIHERGRWSKDLDVAQFEQRDCSTQMFGGCLRLEIGACLVTMPVGCNDQLAEGRKSIGAPDLELSAVAAAIVAGPGVATGRIVG